VPGTPPATSTLTPYAKDGQTGPLAGVAGAPFPDRLEGGRLAVDALGRFLFVLNPNTGGLSMYQINASTGALTDLSGSPFSGGKTINPNQAPANPTALATEKSGKYLYVGCTTGNFANLSAITPYNIDAANLALTPTDQLSFDVPFNPIQMLSDPPAYFFCVVSGINPFNSANKGAVSVYAIAAADGSLALNGSAGGGAPGRGMASDPQGRFFFNGTGQTSDSIYWGTISPLDGTSNPSSQFVDLGAGNFPVAMVVDSSGKYLYVQQSTGLVIYSIDQTSGQPTALTTPPSSPAFQLGNVVADPAGPFLYAGSTAGVRAFQVNSQNGSLTKVADSPFAPGGVASNIAISGTTFQAIRGPSAAFPLSLDFGTVTEGHPVTLVLHLVNNGDQTLTINLGATNITGTNMSDFSQSTTCLVTLAPNGNCSFSVTFNPSSAGVESASLQISDNAPGSPQTIPLSCTGIAPLPSIAFSPSKITFSPIAQGATEGPQTFQVTNIGSAALHIPAITLGGANPQDFSQTNNCTAAPIAINATCAINVSFTPQASSGRTATPTVNDDARNSPQTLLVQGSGTATFVLNAAPQSSTTASITAGQTAHYILQVNAGTGFTGTISLACDGAPVAAKCNLSSNSVSLSSSPVAFNVDISTTGSSSALSPVSQVLRFDWLNGPVPIALILVLIWILGRQSLRLVRCGLVFAAFSLAFLTVGVSGCGGGSTLATAPPQAQPPPQPQVTPKGTYSVTVTATSGNLPSQTITLTLNVN